MRGDPLSTSVASESGIFGYEPEVENGELMKGTTSLELEALIEEEIVLAARHVVKDLYRYYGRDRLEGDVLIGFRTGLLGRVCMPRLRTAPYTRFCSCRCRFTRRITHGRGRYLSCNSRRLYIPRLSLANDVNPCFFSPPELA